MMSQSWGRKKDLENVKSHLSNRDDFWAWRLIFALVVLRWWAWESEF